MLILTLSGRTFFFLSKIKNFAPVATTHLLWRSPLRVLDACLPILFVPTTKSTFTNQSTAHQQPAAQADDAAPTENSPVHTHQPHTAQIATVQALLVSAAAAIAAVVEPGTVVVVLARSIAVAVEELVEGLVWNHAEVAVVASIAAVALALVGDAAAAAVVAGRIAVVAGRWQVVQEAIRVFAAVGRGGTCRVMMAVAAVTVARCNSVPDELAVLIVGWRRHRRNKSSRFLHQRRSTEEPEDMRRKEVETGTVDWRQEAVRLQERKELVDTSSLGVAAVALVYCCTRVDVGKAVKAVALAGSALPVGS